MPTYTHAPGIARAHTRSITNFSIAFTFAVSEMSTSFQENKLNTRKQGIKPLHYICWINFSRFFQTDLTY